MEGLENFYTVILAGGGGTRLWPKSRKRYPKHLLSLFGKKTLLQDTFDRFKKIIPKERIYVITLDEYAKEAIKQLPDLPKENIIKEPEAKNTALAMGTAAAYIHKINPEAVIINEAADHVYQDDEKLKNTVLVALEVASKGNDIVAIGIRPTFAHTGLGYIKIGDQLARVKQDRDDIFVFKGAGFKEKPNQVTAQSFLATGKYLWNANLYCWSTKTILDTLKKLAPEIGKSVEEIYQAIGTSKEEEILRKVYGRAENIQIDYAVSEKADNIVVIPGDFGWSDIGDWKMIYDIGEKDGHGNVINGENHLCVAINSKDCLVENNGRLIALVGLENIVVVDTEDALLICRKDKTQEVKKVIEKLKEEKLEDYF